MGVPYDDEDEDILQKDITPYAPPPADGPQPPLAPEDDGAQGGPSPNGAAQAGVPAASLKDLLLQKYAAASDPSAVNDARQGSFLGHALLGVGQAAENFARAPIIARGGAGANPASYQAMGNALDQRVVNAQNDRTQAMKGVLAQNQLQKQGQAEQLTADANDPNSKQSIAMRQFFQSVYPGTPIPETMSYADAQKIAPALLAKHEATLAKQNSAEKNLTYLSEKEKDRIALLKAKAIEVSGQKQSAADDKAQKQADKASSDQEKTYSELVNRVNTPRGNQAVQAAMSGVVSGQKAQELISQYAGNYDKMPPQQYHLLLEELGKMAHGGIPTEHGIESLDAGTLGEKYNRFLSQVGGEPTGAQVGSFIKENKRYIDGLTSLNRGVVDNYKRSIYKGYKNRLSSDQQKRFETDPDYADMFKNPAAQPAPATPQGGPGQAVAAPAGSTAPAAAVHPQASAAEQWANANRMNPDAATATKAREILKRLGSGGQ